MDFLEICNLKETLSSKLSNMTSYFKSSHLKKNLFFLLLTILSTTVFGAVATDMAPVDGLTCFTVQPDGSSATISWDAVDAAASYRIYYVRESDSLRSQDFTTQGLSIALSGLEEEDYTVYVEALSLDGSTVIASGGIQFLAIGAFFGKVTWGIVILT